MEAADFSGWATKAGLKCSDGRTITANAFQHMNGMKVPLVWQHNHQDPENVLGHVLLEATGEGVRAHGFFNETPKGQHTKSLVKHGDINALSIWANQLVEKAKQVLHGMIREVSLVLSGSNPGALIDFVNIEHSDGEITTAEDEAVIYTGLALEHADASGSNGGSGDLTLQDVYDSYNEQQRNLFHYAIGLATGAGDANVTHSSDEAKPDDDKNGNGGGTEGKDTEDANNDANNTGEGDLKHQEGKEVTHNVFDQNGVKSGDKNTLSHADIKGIVASAQKSGSLKQAAEEYALAHGIENIDVLFPDAKAVADRPEFDKRRTEWVAGVINGTRHTPFSRIKSLSADLTLDEARAKGYVKGNLKKEEFFAVSKRVTTPTTIYKKQKLDRDDIVDITDFDVVAWLKMEMRMMLDEELARAVLIGDGREVDDEDKISETNIRPIATDDDLYAATVYVNLSDASSSYLELVDAIISARRFYKGTGTPTLYTTEVVIANFLTLRDAQGRRIYRTLDDLAAELRVAAIVAVEPMESIDDLVGVMVNFADYTLGADKGGEVNLFDDFDIDYNQYKYLIEARASGALTKIRSALVFRTVGASAGLVTPAAPTQDADEVTVVTTTGATYNIGSFSGAVTYNGSPVTANQTITASFPVVLPDGGSVTIYAVPASSSYYFANNIEDEWTFTYAA